MSKRKSINRKQTLKKSSEPTDPTEPTEPFSEYRNSIRDIISTSVKITRTPGTPGTPGTTLLPDVDNDDDDKFNKNISSKYKGDGKYIPKFKIINSPAFASVVFSLEQTQCIYCNYASMNYCDSTIDISTRSQGVFRSIIRKFFTSSSYFLNYYTGMVNKNSVVSFASYFPGDIIAMRIKKGDKYIINGTKQWITGAGDAGAYTVFAYTEKSRGTRGVSCFYVPRNSPGLTVGKKEDKLGIRASGTHQVIFEDCEISAENLIGKENLGFVYALHTLNASRPYVAAMGVGVAQAALDYSAKYAREREQFGSKIGTFQAVQHLLADMSIMVETGREITMRSARMSDAGDPNLAKYSAIAKAYTSECAVKCATDAVQIFGGYGYTKEYPVEKLMRDSKILTIFEGTTQIQKNEIAAYVIKETAQKK